MLMTLLIVVVVSGALVGGALWGLYGRLPGSVEGFMVAAAGGALIVTAMEELVRPVTEDAGLMVALGGLAIGAVIFSGVDYLIDEWWENSGGSGLLASVTLDGVPENLALGVTLLGTGPMGVAALAGSIFLSNLPEAAGGAKRMCNDGIDRKKVLLVWIGAAVLLSLAAIMGNLLLRNISEEWLGIIKCTAAGAIVASLATEIFPKAYKENAHLSGIATALGLGIAASLAQLAPS